MDVYLGFILFLGWIIYREEKIGTALLWIVAVMILGNSIASVYALLALLKNDDDRKKFWLGAKI